VVASLVARERSRGSWSTGILATPEDKASSVIVISVDNERDENIFIFGIVFEFCEGEADGKGVEEDCRRVCQQVS
jgi:hypothetical protein